MDGVSILKAVWKRSSSGHLWIILVRQCRVYRSEAGMKY